MEKWLEQCFASTAKTFREKLGVKRKQTNFTGTQLEAHYYYIVVISETEQLFYFLNHETVCMGWQCVYTSLYLAQRQVMLGHSASGGTLLHPNIYIWIFHSHVHHCELVRGAFRTLV